MKSDRATAPLIPGFDFLKTLAGQAGKGIEGLNQLNTLGQGLGAGLGGFKQWVAPTLDPDELDKRIEELRTVQFWLEQNARLLGATIQALEVQKMTLSTLRTMNVKMPDLQQVLGAMVPPAPSPSESAHRWGSPSVDAQQAAERSAGKRSGSDTGSDTGSDSTAGAGKGPAKPRKGGKSSKGGESAGLVDPMKWWGALTDQFQQLASQALAAAPGATAGAAAAAAGGASGTAGAGAKRAPTRSKAGAGTTSAGSNPRSGKPAASGSKAPAGARARRKV
jgi:hypothetical protein